MKRLLLALCLLYSLAGLAQRTEIDSLQRVLSTKLPDSSRAKVLQMIAKKFLHISGDTSERYALEAISMARKSGQLKTEAEGYGLLGAVQKDKGNYDEALTYHLKALKLKEAMADEAGLATTHNDIGVLLKKNGRLDDALTHYMQSNALCKKTGNLKGVAMTYNNIGTIYRERRKPDSALYFYRLGLTYAEKLGDSYSIATCLTNVGDILQEKGKNKEALEIFARCLQYDKANEDKSGIAASYNNLARTSGAIRQFDQAFLYSDSAIAVSLRDNLPQERLNAYSIRSTLEEASGNVSEALAFHKKKTMLRDSLMNEETNRQLSELQTKYETEKKEQQIALQQSELKKKNYLIAAAFGLLILAGLLSYSYYNRYKLRQQSRLQEAIIHQQELATHAVIEAEERERKRIAGDLHDGVGQLMSAAKMNLSLVAGELDFTSNDQQRAFEKAMALVDEGCREVRTVSHNIMPNALLKSGLSTAIREFLGKIDERIIKVNLYTEGLNERIEGNAEPVLYRIVQECVNNVIKHAGASQLDISIIRDEDGISITIEDNGKGFDMRDHARLEGIGMKNIQSRADYLNGTVEWDSSPGKGTVVMVHVPV